MATSKFKRALFIVGLLNGNKTMSQEEIKQRYKLSFPSDTPPSRSTFIRLKNFIEENFPCKIIYDVPSNSYHLETSMSKNENDIRLFQYIMSMYNVMDTTPLLTKHRDKVANTDIVTGTENLDIVLKAIDTNKGMLCTYTSFAGGTTKTRTIIPYFLSTWEGRWYVIAEPTTHPGSLVVYALERMRDISLTAEDMPRTKQITKEQYFRDSYGIQHSDGTEAEEIILRVSKNEVPYLRAKPIHPSQIELEATPEYSLFRLRLIPCYNFYQQLLWHRETIEVLEPESVRFELASIAEKIIRLYGRAQGTSTVKK